MTAPPSPRKPKPKPKPADPRAFDVIREAIHCLRRAPARFLAPYYVGSVPFVLALLYFWADMSYSAFARPRCAGAALVLSLLFVWMKTWHTIAMRGLLAELRDESPQAWSPRRLMQAIAVQAYIQATSLFLLPLCLLAVGPFPWAYAFYQHASVIGDGEGEGARACCRRAAALARRWPQQNLLLVWLICPLTLVVSIAFFLVISPIMRTVGSSEGVEWARTIYSVIAGILVAPLAPMGALLAVNYGAVLLLIPSLGRMFLGMEGLVAHQPGLLVSSTFAAVVVSMVYLTLDPVAKVAYVLRTFRGESERTAEDLLARLRTFGIRGGGLALLILAGAYASTASAQSAPPTSAVSPAAPVVGASAPVVPAELDRAIGAALQQREYAWRMPRVEQEEELGFVGQFINAIGERVHELAQKIISALERFVNWLRGHAPHRAFPSGGFLGLGITARAMSTVLLIVALVALAVILIRMWLNRRPSLVVVADPAPPAMPDIEDENVSAADLPEDEWMTLAHDLTERGEFRLALRALFLATLAHLGRAGLVRLERYKSNRDYSRELERRSHVFPDVPGAFTQTVGAFERVWYGNHEIGREGVARFQWEQEHLRSVAEGRP